MVCPDTEHSRIYPVWRPSGVLRVAPDIKKAQTNWWVHFGARSNHAGHSCVRAQSKVGFEELCSPLVVHAFVEYSLNKPCTMGSKRTVHCGHPLRGRFLECRGGLSRERRHCRFRQLLLVLLLLLLPVGLRLGRGRPYVGLGGR